MTPVVTLILVNRKKKSRFLPAFGMTMQKRYSEKENTLTEQY
jgi:hypothetical protein